MNIKNKNLFIFITIAIILTTAIIFIFIKYILTNYTKSTLLLTQNTTTGITKEKAKGTTDTTNLKNETITTKTGAKIIVVKSYDESMFKGKKSLVFIWASWCSHCLDEISVIKETMKDYSNKGYNIYAISHDNDLDTLTAFMEKENIEFNVYFDKGRIMRSKFDPEASTVPLLYVLNKDISIGKKNDGVADKTKVLEFINYINANK